MSRFLIITILIAISFFSFGCMKDYNEDQLQAATNVDKAILTLENIVNSYESEGIGKVVGVTEYKHYVLIEYINPADMRWFNWHNLKTGDKDSVGNMDTNSKLVQIISGDHLVFESDGVCTLNGHRFFPFSIECYRDYEATGYDGEFRSERKVKYLEIDEGYEFGVKSDVLISDIKVTLQGLEMLFSPMEGKEGSFYIGYTTIPVINTSYKPENNQFIIKLKNTEINPKLNTHTIKEQNAYIKSIELKKAGSDTNAIINLKETAKYYTARNGHTEPAKDDFPFIEFAFINKLE